MASITKLQLQRRKRRVNVFLDEEYRFSLALDIAAKLKRGQVLSDADIESLKAEDDYKRALDRALKFLEYRPRSRAEVERKLREKDFAPESMDRALDRLEELRLVDDARFAAWWVENRLRHRPRGARALRSELFQRGIDRDTADAAIGELDEPEMALDLAMSRVERFRGAERREYERRMGAYLQRRGFDYGAVRHALKASWAHLESDEPEG